MSKYPAFSWWIYLTLMLQLCVGCAAKRPMPLLLPATFSFSELAVPLEQVSYADLEKRDLYVLAVDVTVSSETNTFGTIALGMLDIERHQFTPSVYVSPYASAQDCRRVLEAMALRNKGRTLVVSTLNGRSIGDGDHTATVPKLAQTFIATARKSLDGVGNNLVWMREGQPLNWTCRVVWGP